MRYAECYCKGLGSYRRRSIMPKYNIIRLSTNASWLMLWGVYVLSVWEKRHMSKAEKRRKLEEERKGTFPRDMLTTTAALTRTMLSSLRKFRMSLKTATTIRPFTVWRTRLHSASALRRPASSSAQSTGSVWQAYRIDTKLPAPPKAGK